jgi:hypothetical protein
MVKKTSVGGHMRDIEVGWTEKQVRNSMEGAGPDKITAKKTGTTVWTYGQWPFGGTVTFKDGKVISLRLPPFENYVRWY